MIGSQALSAPVHASFRAIGSRRFRRQSDGRKILWRWVARKHPAVWASVGGMIAAGRIGATKGGDYLLGMIRPQIVRATAIV